MAKQPNPAIVQAIIDGEHDEHLSGIIQAAQWRTKRLWRKGTRIRLKGTKNVDLEGKEGVITKVNSRTISVGLGTVDVTEWGNIYSDGEYNVPPALLERLS